MLGGVLNGRYAAFTATGAAYNFAAIYAFLGSNAGTRYQSSIRWVSAPCDTRANLCDTSLGIKASRLSVSPTHSDRAQRQRWDSMMPLPVVPNNVACVCRVHDMWR